MYNDQQYCDFEPKFINYIKTGILPEGFQNVAQLKKHIQDNLTFEHRGYLMNSYHLDNHPLLGLYWWVPSAPLEGLAVSAIPSLLSLYSPLSLPAALGIGAALGACWCAGRIVFRMICKLKEAEDNKIRLDPFEDILSQPNISVIHLQDLQANTTLEYNANYRPQSQIRLQEQQTVEHIQRRKPRGVKIY